jgi:hypothetical protein
MSKPLLPLIKHELIMRSKEDRSMLHMYICRQHNETQQKQFEKGGRRNRYDGDDELVPGILYTFMELSQ